MSFLDWLFGKKKPAPVSQPMVTVGMDSDEWLDMMLETLDERDRRKERKVSGDPWACYDEPRGGE